MTKKVRITADSTCDLSPELVERYGITILPLYVNLDGAMYRDGVDVNPDMIFDLFREKKVLPKTAAVSVQDYIDVFSRMKEEEDCEIVHIDISSDFSSCYQNACLAAEEVGGVYPVDSRNLSTGIGHIVLRAAEMAEEGMNASDIQKACVELTDLVEASFVISNLIFLYKGGRCSATSAIMGSALNIKPSIEVKDGKMGVGKKYRGSYEKCLVRYVTDHLKDRDDIDPRRLFITRSSGPEEIDRAVLEEVKKYIDFEEIHYTYAGCTVCGHCGPETLGILYMRKPH